MNGASFLRLYHHTECIATTRTTETDGDVLTVKHALRHILVQVQFVC